LDVAAPRALTHNERAVLDLLLTRSFDGRDALVAQARTAETNGLSCDCGCPSFSLVPDRKLPESAFRSGVASDAHGTDPGGNDVGVLLWAEDGYLVNVEVYSFLGDFAGLPDHAALKLSQWSDRDSSGARRLLTT
jgi:hypothetical protein